MQCTDVLGQPQNSLQVQNSQRYYVEERQGKQSKCTLCYTISHSSAKLLVEAV